MYIHFSALLSVAALAVGAAAAPSALKSRNGSQCDNGSIECCQQTYSQNDPGLTSVLATLGVVLSDVQGLVGVGCSSMKGTGASCSQQSVCCTGNTNNALVYSGCNNININL